VDCRQLLDQKFPTLPLVLGLKFLTVSWEGGVL